MDINNKLNENYLTQMNYKNMDFKIKNQNEKVI